MTMRKSVSALRWRRARWSDRFFIARIGNEIHRLQERAVVFDRKLRLFPDGCRILMHKSRRVGYGLAHPWRLGEIPPLDAVIEALPADPDCLFVHDVAIDDSARGREAGGAYVALMERLAMRRGLRALAGVAVYGTHAMWRRRGFIVAASDGSAISRKLRSYDDPQVCYATCRLPQKIRAKRRLIRKKRVERRQFRARRVTAAARPRWEIAH